MQGRNDGRPRQAAATGRGRKGAADPGRDGRRMQHPPFPRPDERRWRRGGGAATADGRAALDGADGGGGRRSRRRSGAVEDEDGRDGRRGGRIRDGQELLLPSRDWTDDGDKILLLLLRRN